MSMKPQMEALTTNQVRPAGKQAPSKQAVSLMLSQLAADALRGESATESGAARLEIAIRCYLGDRDTRQAAWPYPAFLRGSEVREEVDLALDIEARLWSLFEAEALRQEVSAQQLAEHASFYFAAELDAGRLTQRILDDLESSAPEAEES
jgi:hypothetical protein